MSHVEETLTLVERGNTLEVQNQSDYDKAGEFMKGGTELIRKIKEHYRGTKETPGPIHQAHLLHASLVKAEAQLISPIESIINHVKGLRIGWTGAEDERAAEEQKRLQTLADARGIDATDYGTLAPVIQIQSKAQKTDGIHERTTWRCRVVDASRVPREYLMPDMTLLHAKARSMKEGFNIPGCVAEPDTNEIVRSL